MLCLVVKKVEYLGSKIESKEVSDSQSTAFYPLSLPILTAIVNLCFSLYLFFCQLLHSVLSLYSSLHTVITSALHLLTHSIKIASSFSLILLSLSHHDNSNSSLSISSQSCHPKAWWWMWRQRKGWRADTPCTSESKQVRRESMGGSLCCAVRVKKRCHLWGLL